MNQEQQLLADARQADLDHGVSSPISCAAWSAYREYVDYNKPASKGYWAIYCTLNPYAPECKEYDV